MMSPRRMMRMTMTLNELEKLFSGLSTDVCGHQKKIEWPCPLGVYYGLNSSGQKRLSFLSSRPAPKLISTKQLDVMQIREADSIYWTCFDLRETKANNVFYVFCFSLLAAIKNATTENDAIIRLKKRYMAWKSLFERPSSANTLSREAAQGLFGELYFIKKILSQTTSLQTCIRAWRGPNNDSKDFSLHDTWYEVKTIGSNSISVKISSLGQLYSAIDGHLVVIKAELMSSEFSNGESSIGELFDYILNNLYDEDVEKLFLDKMALLGVNTCDDECLSIKFDVKNISCYNVRKGFPLINAEDVGKLGIVDVSYSVLISAMESFKED